WSKNALDTTPPLNIATPARNGAHGLESVTLTVFASGAVTSVTWVIVKVQALTSVSRARLSEKMTSSGVKSLPSENFAARKLNVTVSPSADTSYFSASPGSSPFESLLDLTSVS